MSRREQKLQRRSAGDGSTTSGEGTPVPVDTSIDREASIDIVVFLSTPIIWAAHFFLVYLVAEAGCTGEGPGLRVFDPPVPAVFTLVATAVAVLGCVACTVWAYRRWRAGRAGRAEDSVVPPAADGAGDRHPGATLLFAGVLLGPVSLISVLMVGLPALVLAPC